MAGVVLICGKLCSGKSTYARKLQGERGGVLLSVDELMLELFGMDAGERHDEYAEKTQKYLLKKSLELIRCGCDVILDWGFWMREKRREALEFYKGRNIPCELHYLDLSDREWLRRVEERNRKVLAGEESAYLVDEGLKMKFQSLFEPPKEEEIDVRVS